MTSIVGIKNTMEVNGAPETALFPTFFRISSFVFCRTKTFIQDWNYLRVSKWWQHFHFWVNYPFKCQFFKIRIYKWESQTSRWLHELLSWDVGKSVLTLIMVETLIYNIDHIIHLWTIYWYQWAKKVFSNGIKLITQLSQFASCNKLRIN